ncbi:MAG: helix-turn-helix domain-containing protein [Streptosporangiaceae bacterium]
MEKLLYRPKEAAQVLGIGRATLYDLMHAGKIRSVKDGHMRVHHPRRAARVRPPARGPGRRGRLMPPPGPPPRQRRRLAHQAR